MAAEGMTGTCLLYSQQTRIGGRCAALPLPSGLSCWSASMVASMLLSWLEVPAILEGKQASQANSAPAHTAVVCQHSQMSWGTGLVLQKYGSCGSQGIMGSMC